MDRCACASGLYILPYQCSYGVKASCGESPPPSRLGGLRRRLGGLKRLGGPKQRSALSPRRRLGDAIRTLAAAAAAAPPPGRSISAGGSALVGCPADPSDPPCLSSSSTTRGPTSPPGFVVAAAVAAARSGAPDDRAPPFSRRSSRAACGRGWTRQGSGSTPMPSSSSLGSGGAPAWYPWSSCCCFYFPI